MSVQPKIGVMGGGRMGRVHMNALLQIPGCEVAVLVDPMHSEIALPSGTVKVSSLEDAFHAVGNLDGLVIATPTPTHADNILEAIKLKVPVVFVEKPIAQTLDEVGPIRDALAANAQLTEIMMGFHRRHDAQFKKFRKELISEKESHALRAVHIVNYDKDPPTKQQGYQCNVKSQFTKEMGSIFVDFTTHDFDNLRFVTGEDFEVENVLHKRNAETEEEEAMIILRGQASGCRAVIENSRNCGYGHDQRGTAVLSNGKHIHTDSLDKMHDVFLEHYKMAYEAQMHHFYEGVCSRIRGVSMQSVAAASLEDGVTALKMALDCECLCAEGNSAFKKQKIV